MNIGLVMGCIIGALLFLLLAWMVHEWLRATKYEHAVQAFIGVDWELFWNNEIYFDYYWADADAADCAREMVAVNCEP